MLSIIIIEAVCNETRRQGMIKIKKLPVVSRTNRLWNAQDRGIVVVQVGAVELVAH
jgi:hypothetical protein